MIRKRRWLYLGAFLAVIVLVCFGLVIWFGQESEPRPDQLLIGRWLFDDSKEEMEFFSDGRLMILTGTDYTDRPGEKRESYTLKGQYFLRKANRIAFHASDDDGHFHQEEVTFEVNADELRLHRSGGRAAVGHRAK